MINQLIYNRKVSFKTEWGYWSECNVSCNIGTKMRKRYCNKEKICKNETSIQYEECNVNQL
jgi:hypothetical protein